MYASRIVKAEHSPGFVDTAFEWTRPAHEYDPERAVVSRIRSQHAAGEEVGPDCKTRAAQVVYTAMLGPLSVITPVLILPTHKALSACSAKLSLELCITMNLDLDRMMGPSKISGQNKDQGTPDIPPLLYRGAWLCSIFPLYARASPL